MSTTSTSYADSFSRVTASVWVAACAATASRPGSDRRSTSRRDSTSESSISRMRRSAEEAPLVSGAWASVELIARLLQQVVLDRVVRDVRVRFHAHLLQNARAVGADRLHAQEQFGRDLRNALAFREFREDLKLPLRQHAMPRFVGRTALDTAHQQLREL